MSLLVAISKGTPLGYKTVELNAGFSYQLNGSHVFLPPQKLLEARSSSRKAIIEIHDDMDGRVHHGMERSHSTLRENMRH